MPVCSEPREALTTQGASCALWIATYIDVPHKVRRGQGELDVLRQGELLSDPPSREHRGGLGVLERNHTRRSSEYAL